MRLTDSAVARISMRDPRRYDLRDVAKRTRALASRLSVDEANDVVTELESFLDPYADLLADEVFTSEDRPGSGGLEARFGIACVKVEDRARILVVLNAEHAWMFPDDPTKTEDYFWEFAPAKVKLRALRELPKLLRVLLREVLRRW